MGGVLSCRLLLTGQGWGDGEVGDWRVGGWE